MAITPEQLAAGGTEDGHQLALFCWAALNFEKYPELKRMFAIPNGGYRDKREAAKLKAMGVKRGVPDICLPVTRLPFAGLFIELKKLKGGVVSDEQDDWGDYLKSQRFGFAVCKGWIEARNMLIQYLEWNK